MVIKHCRYAGIFIQGLKHDLSKYTPSEFIPGVKYYQGNRSPNEGEREATDIQGHGCTIRAETDTTLNIGPIMILIQSFLLP